MNWKKFFIGEKHYKNEYMKDGAEHKIEVSVTVGLLPILSLVGLLGLMWLLFFR